MDREFNAEILKRLGIEKARELYQYAKSHPILLPAIIKEHLLQEIEEYLRQNKSKHYIARQTGKSVRTIERFIEKYFPAKK